VVLCSESRGMLSGVDMIVAGLADHNGFASPFRHGLCPRGLVWPSCVEIGQFADLVDLHRVRAVAELASSLKESCNDFLAAVDDLGRCAVDDDRVFLPCEWDSTEPCDQWLPAVAWDPDFVARALGLSRS
jgi:hypothetical protein